MNVSPAPRPDRIGRGEGALVGRADELEQLLSVYDTVLGGRAMTVLLGGDAGIGKSRLAAEFCDEARLRGAVVATGSCVPFDGGLAYAPVMGILRDLSRQVSASPRVEDVLHVLGGDANAADSGDHADGTDADATKNADGATATTGSRPAEARPDKAGFARTAMFETILQTLLEIAEAAPVLLLVEDIHWCDSSSAQLIDFIARNAADSRLLMVCTYRPEDIDAGSMQATRLAELTRLPRTASIALGPLAYPDLATMLAERKGYALDRQVLQSVWNRSQGNPFYAEQLAAAGERADVPATVQAVIVDRVARLGLECRQLLTVASVAGITFGHDLLDRVMGIQPDLLAASLTEAIDHGMLALDASGTGYRFRHALLREAMYNSVLPAQRRSTHRAFAQALEADATLGATATSHHAAELAGHWWASGDAVAALGPSVAAGDAARTAFAFAEALTHYEHALAGLDAAVAQGVETHWTRVQLLEKAAEAAYLCAATDRAISLGRAAVEEALAVGDVLVAARCYVLVGRSMWGIGDSDGAFAVYASAAEILPDEPSPERAAVLAEQARAFMLMSRNAEGRAKAEEAIAAAAEANAVAVGGHARNTLGCCLAALGEPERAVALLREAVEIAEETLSPEDLNRGYGNLSYILVSVGRIEEGANVVFDALAVGEEIGGMRLNSAASNSIEALMHLGRWDEAEKLQEMVGVAPYGSCVASTFVDRLPFAIRRARYTDVDSWLASAHELTDGLHDVQFSASLHCLEAEYHLDRDDPAGALELMRTAVALAVGGDEPKRLPEYLHVGLRAAADAVRDPRRFAEDERAAIRATADEWLDAAEDGIKRWLATGAPLPPLDEGFQLLCRAEHTRLERSDPDAWLRAAQRFDATPSVYLTAYCRLREAEALVETRGSRSRAVEALTSAWEVSRRLGSVPLTNRIEALAERARIELHPSEPANGQPDAAGKELGLTVRENEILRYLAVGDSDRDIAERLYISKKTVSVHVSNILRKLQVSSRIEAGKIAQTHGIRA